MHQAKRAIIMAAGSGKRLRPLTLTTPKPLIRVNGKRMIDTVIRGLHHNGITEIHVVVGYQKEKFESLKETYEGIRLIENPFFDTCNNISSLYMARDLLEDAIITDADLLVYDSSILNPLFERSGYNCVWTDTPTEEWLLTLEDSIVRSCSRTGGKSGWQLFSISRWTAEDGRKLKRHLEYQFMDRKNRQIYWDDVALFCHPEEYRLGIREMRPGAIAEVDSLHDLVTLDPSYSI